MRIINRRNLPWFIFVCLATIGACTLYVANFHPAAIPSWIPLPLALLQRPSEHQAVGGTPLGLAFGAISLGIFIFAALLRLREKIPFWRALTVQRWLRAHIWLTLLTIPLVLLHTGFRLGGPMTTLLMAIYAVVMASGIYGLFLQHFIPTLMLKWLPAETVYKQIPYIRTQLAAAAKNMRDSFLSSSSTQGTDVAPRLAKAITVRAPPMMFREGHLTTPSARAKTTAGSTVTAETVSTSPAPSAAPHQTETNADLAAARDAGRPLRQADLPSRPAQIAPLPADPASETILSGFIDDQILPYLSARNGRKLRMGDSDYAKDTFRFMKLQVTPAYQIRVDEIQAWCEERRMLDLQTRLHHWLHGWLFIHVPMSFFLLVVTGWHAFEMLFSYG